MIFLRKYLKTNKPFPCNIGNFVLKNKFYFVFKYLHFKKLKLT